MLRHLSHRHRLCPFEVEEEDPVCSGCELDLSGSACKCNARSSTCNFHLHKSCFELQRKIQHASHPQHPLTFLPVGACSLAVPVMVMATASATTAELAISTSMFGALRFQRLSRAMIIHKVHSHWFSPCLRR